MKQSLCIVTSNTEVIPGVNLMWLEAPDIANTAQPGQFITVCCDGLVLRRPFSIHQVDSNRVALLFNIKGKGTFWLSQRQVGDKIDILGPLGRGFSIESGSGNLLLVAGGIGIAPLAFLMQYASLRHSITLIHGAVAAAQLYSCSSLPLLRNQIILNEEGKGDGEKQSNLLPQVRFIPVTEDGSLGRKGLVTDILPDFLDWADQVYACGPLDMFKTMANMICNSKSFASYHSEKTERRENLPQDKLRFVIASEAKQSLERCQVSLEVRMGCGIGACYGCTINTREGLKRVCRDGPVFELGDILWEEVKI